MRKKIILLLVPALIIATGSVVIFEIQKSHASTVQVALVAPEFQEIDISPTPEASESTIPSPQLTPNKNRTTSQKKTATPIQISDLKSAVQKKYNAKTTFTTDTSTDGFVQGTLNNGKWFLAIKNDTQWKIVLDGYSYVNCSDIAPYNFPSSVVPACWGKGTLVNRK